MSPPDPLPLGGLVTAINLVGSVVLAGYVAVAAAALVRGRGVPASRLIVADGVVLALGIKTAGALLKTLELRGWGPIATFAAVLALRTFMKRTFAWQREHLRFRVDASEHFDRRAVDESR